MMGQAEFERRDSSPSDSGRVLDPLERSSEIMFGLIMALTFTCTVSVVSSTRNDVMMMLAAALSCNIAWGLVDGAMYVLAEMVSHQRRQSLSDAMAAASPPEARRLLLEHMPDGAGSVLSPDDLDRLAAGVRASAADQHAMVHIGAALYGGTAVFLLVFLSTLPVALPFLVISDVSVALRTSNAIAIILLFLVGTSLGRYMNLRHAWAAGLAIALFGAALVAITIALGG